MINPTGLYHVIARGVGQMVIFEDAQDHGFFLHMSFDLAKEHDILIVAYCLMDNHVHMIVKDNCEQLSRFMARLLGIYAQHFNVKYSRSGHVFQDRFNSLGIDSRGYLLEVYRYIMNNPVKAGICPAESYRWSSYQDYYEDEPVTDVSMIKELLPGVDAFAKFMKEKDHEDVSYYGDHSPRLTDEELIGLIRRLAGCCTGSDIAALPRKERDPLIRRLRGEGYSIKQIARVTGIGRSIIERLKPGENVSEEPSP